MSTRVYVLALSTLATISLISVLQYAGRPVPPAPVPVPVCQEKLINRGDACHHDARVEYVDGNFVCRCPHDGDPNPRSGTGDRR